MEGLREQYMRNLEVFTGNILRAISTYKRWSKGLVNISLGGLNDILNNIQSPMINFNFFL